jgi:hypothetical protein
VLLVFMSTSKSGVNAEVGESEALLHCREPLLLVIYESDLNNSLP